MDSSHLPAKSRSQIFETVLSKEEKFSILRSKVKLFSSVKVFNIADLEDSKSIEADSDLIDKVSSENIAIALECLIKETKKLATQDTERSGFRDSLNSEKSYGSEITELSSGQYEKDMHSKPCCLCQII